REEATCVYATATDRYGVHAVIDICTHATAQGIPLTAVPACYVGGACAPCCAEITTHIYIVRAGTRACPYGYGTDTVIDAIACATAEGIPLAAVPARYVVDVYSACHVEVTAHVDVAAACSYRVDIIIRTTHAATEGVAAG